MKITERLKKLLKFEHIFDGEEIIACKKREINWPYDYRLSIKAIVVKQEACRKYGHKPDPKKVWGYFIDRWWVHWEEYIGFTKIGTREDAIESGIKRMEKLLGRKLKNF
jgi:hypothetical protein